MREHGPVAAVGRRALTTARAALLAGLCAGLFLGLLGACAAPNASARVARRLGGERTDGAFVSPTSYELFVRAELASSNQRWAEAVQFYRLALAGAAEDPLVLARLAVALARAGRFEDADAAVARALELDAESEAAFLARGDVALLRDDRATAVAAYEHAAEAAPESEQGPMRLAATLRALGAEARANAVLARLAQRGGAAGATAARANLAAALAGDDAEAAGEAALALLRVAPANARDVREAATRALAADKVGLAARLIAALPVHEADTALRVRIALARGARSEAEGLLATATPDALGGPADQARLWLAAGRPEQAYELAAGADASQPSPELALLAAEAALAAGRLDDAAARFVGLRADDASAARAREGLAEALRRAGLPALAAETLVPRGGP